jgi:signal transduction histidine kinase
MSLTDKLGNFIGALIAQNRASQERQRLAIRAELGDLAAFVAHEINTPLGIILMKAERLLTQTPDEQQRIKLQEVMNEAERGGRIVNELLADVGRRHGEGKACDINSAIEHALRLIESLLETQRIQPKYELQEVPIVAMEESKVKQIFFNLVRNAVDAMPRSGTLIVQTRLASDGNRVELRVRDTGSGIPEDLREKIFHPYFTTKEHGTGLGLSMCRMLAQEYGGDITVESEEGKGSTFVVTFPFKERSSWCG